MRVDRDYIGRSFHNLMYDMAEDYVLTTPDGEEHQGKVSLVAKTASTYMLAEREFLHTGAMTFPSMEAQTLFRGCYFHRAINPNRIYMLASTIPKDTTPLVADIFAVECNAKVDLAYLVEKTDRKGDLISTPIVFEENVPVYWDSTLQKQQQSSDGNVDQTRFFIQIPARYGIGQDEIVIRKQIQYNQKINMNEIIETRFRVQSVDMSLFGIYQSEDKEDTVYGICDVQLSLDTSS